MSVSLGARCIDRVTIEMLDDRWTTVSAQNARVLSAWRAVNSGSSPSSSACLSRADSLACGLRLPSGSRPMSSGRFLIAVDTGPMIARRNTPDPKRCPAETVVIDTVCQDPHHESAKMYA